MRRQGDSAGDDSTPGKTTGLDEMEDEGSSSREFSESPSVSSSTRTTTSPSPEKKKQRRKRRPPAVPWKKPPGMPKRPLSAYNLFFQQERQKLLESRIPSPPVAESEGSPGDTGSGSQPRRHLKSSGIGFANLAKQIGAKWKQLAPHLKTPFEELAAKEKARYDEEMLEWRANQKAEAAKLAQQKETIMAEAPTIPDAGQVFQPGPILEPSPPGIGMIEPYPEKWFEVGGSFTSGTHTSSSSRELSDDPIPLHDTGAKYMEDFYGYESQKIHHSPRTPQRVEDPPFVSYGHESRTIHYPSSSAGRGVPRHDEPTSPHRVFHRTHSLPHLARRNPSLYQGRHSPGDPYYAMTAQRRSLDAATFSAQIREFQDDAFPLEYEETWARAPPPPPPRTPPTATTPSFPPAAFSPPPPPAGQPLMRPPQLASQRRSPSSLPGSVGEMRYLNEMGTGPTNKADDTNNSVMQSSLEALDSSLDEESVDFLTRLRFH